MQQKPETIERRVVTEATQGGRVLPPEKTLRLRPGQEPERLLLVTEKKQPEQSAMTDREDLRFRRELQVMRFRPR